MPIEAQTRLLRVLQEGEYTTVGGNRTIKANVRIITATHRDLKLLIRQGLFREDLYYRLNVVPLRIPALRERKEDISDLVSHFCLQAAEGGLAHKIIDKEGMLLLQEYPGQETFGNWKILSSGYLFCTRNKLLHEKRLLKSFIQVSRSSMTSK